MLSAAYVCKPRFVLNRIAPLFLGPLAIVLMGGGLLRAQVVATYTFNNGTADGWTSFNGATTPTASSTETFGGRLTVC
jgi:endo-1,4-beta-xylanase